MDFKFDLGDTVKCQSTEMQGKISQLTKHIYSQNRYCVQPPYNTKDMKMPSAHFIDETSLKLIAKSELDTIHKYKDGKFTLGDVVEDTLSEQEGKIVERSLCLNGCYRLKISFKNKKDENAYGYWVEEKGAGLVTPIKETNTKPSDRSTGTVMEEYAHE